MDALGSEQLNVSAAFDNSCVLITGASGFLGKVLLEKLLFAEPKISKIFLLVRPLQNQSARVRVEKLLESPIFNRVRCVDESRFKRLVPVSGDLMQEGMGLAEEERAMLAREVNIVFHCAATVKFDESLRISIQMNVIGTQRLVSFCRQMEALKSFVHASTAYANCNRASTEERIYETTVDSARLVEATQWMDTQMMDSVASQLLENRPNTYTFAKAVAESQLKRETELPLIIVRPSIIGAIWREPLPGWMDNVNGPTGIFAAVGKGLLTDMCGDTRSNADIIPVDVVSNMLIVAGAYRARLRWADSQNWRIRWFSEKGVRPDEIPVIHCTSGELNPIKWEKIVIYIEQFFLAFPFDQCYRVPSTQFHSSRKAFLLNFYAKHMSVAYGIDALYRLVGKKPKFVRQYGKIWRMMETLHYFTTRGWKFESTNALKLWDCLNEEHKKLYPFDVRKVDWDKYLFDYLMGIKIYLLKEQLDELPKSQANLLWRKQFNLYANGAFFALLVRLFAWRRPKRQRWALWLSGFLVTYACQNLGFLLRPKVYLRSLDEYRRVALPYYAQHGQKQGNT